jgi:hypothetical protein
MATDPGHRPTVIVAIAGLGFVGEDVSMLVTGSWTMLAPEGRFPGDGGLAEPQLSLTT